MTYTKEITLWCEHAGVGGDDCQEWVTLNNYESRGGKVDAARLWARRDRWTYVDGKDLCPKHSTIRQKAPDDPIFDGPGVTLQDVQHDYQIRNKQP